MSAQSESTIQALLTERDELKRHSARLQALAERMGFPPGHFYSPVIDPEDPFVIEAVRERLWGSVSADVRLDREAIRLLLHRLARHRDRFPFSRTPAEPHRYYFDNPFFGCHDALVYFAMILEFAPRQVIEVGCGFSSRLLLDTNQQFFGGRIEITLIDPSPDALPTDAPSSGVCLRACRLQETPLDLFDHLDSNDILFLDSSHVSKTGSDVNFYMFQILPRLKPGVIVHIHDIFFPFEYPSDWVLNEKRSWNEAYLLHAFLQFNPAFEILYWNNFAFHILNADLRELMPLCLENEGGSIWLRRK